MILTNSWGCMRQRLNMMINQIQFKEPANYHISEKTYMMYRVPFDEGENDFYSTGVVIKADSLIHVDSETYENYINII